MTRWRVTSFTVRLCWKDGQCPHLNSDHSNIIDFKATSKSSSSRQADGVLTSGMMAVAGLCDCQPVASDVARE
jgi:hypothetical protein